MANSSEIEEVKFSQYLEQDESGSNDGSSDPSILPFVTFDPVGPDARINAFRRFGSGYFVSGPAYRTWDNYPPSGDSLGQVNKITDRAFLDLTFRMQHAAVLSSAYTTHLNQVDSDKLLVSAYYWIFTNGGPSQFLPASFCLVNHDGTIDPVSFAFPVTGPEIFSFAPFSDATTKIRRANRKIINVGSFGTSDPTVKIGVCQFNSDGTYDLPWGMPFSDPSGTNVNFMKEVVLLPDESCVIIGSFTGGTPSPLTNIAKLDVAGNLDLVFDANVAGGTNESGLGIQRILLDDTVDQKLYLLSNAPTFAGVPVGSIFRIGYDGVLDLSFSTLGRIAGVPPPFTNGTGAMVKGMAGTNTFYLALDASLNAGSTYDGLPFGGIVRIFDDGSIDPSFTGRVAEFSGGDAMIRMSPTNNKVIMSGNFLFYDGKRRNFVTGINEDGSVLV